MCIYKPLLRYIVLTAVLFLITGCAGLSKQEHESEYYTLEYEAPIVKGQMLPVVLKIEQFAVSPLYNTDNLVYRDYDFLRKEYAYHQWSVSPESMITSLLSRDLRRSGLFKAVTEPGSTLSCTYRLEGRVNQIYEKDLPEQWVAVLEIEITFLRCQEKDPFGKVLYQRSYESEVKSIEKSPLKIVQAMSQAMQKISRSIIEDLYKAVSREVEVKSNGIEAESSKLKVES